MDKVFSLSSNVLPLMPDDLPKNRFVQRFDQSRFCRLFVPAANRRIYRLLPRDTFFFLRPVFTAWKSLYHSPRPYEKTNFRTMCEKSDPTHRRRPMSGIRFFAGIACVWHEKMTKSGRWVSAAQPRAMNSASSAAWPVSSCHRSSFVLSSVKLPVPFSYCRASFSTPFSLSVSVTQRQSS